MKYLYEYRDYKEIVTEQQMTDIRRVTKNGKFSPIALIATPPEAIQELAQEVTVTKKEKAKEIDPNK